MPPWLDKILSPLDSILDKFIPDKAERLKAAAAAEALKASVAETVLTHEAAVIKEQASIVRAEATGGGLRGSWRPVTALVFVAIVANNYILAPYASALFGTSVSLPIPPEMWDLLKVMIGGYVLSRGVEKGIAVWKG